MNARTNRRAAAILIAAAIAAGSVCTAGEKRLERPGERRLNERQPPVEVMDAMGLMPGMKIADIGAGRGRYTVWFAERVGDVGRVYANEIEQDLLDEIAERCSALGFGNVETILGSIDHPRLPEGALDIAFMINVYHHLEEQHEMIVNTKPGLKPGGRLVIVECDPVKAPAMDGHSTPRDSMVARMERAGFALDRIEDFLETDNIYIFRAAGVESKQE